MVYEDMGKKIEAITNWRATALEAWNCMTGAMQDTPDRRLEQVEQTLLHVCSRSMLWNVSIDVETGGNQIKIFLWL